MASRSGRCLARRRTWHRLVLWLLSLWVTSQLNVVPACHLLNTGFEFPSWLSATDRRFPATAGWSGAIVSRSSSSVAMASIEPCNMGGDILREGARSPRQVVLFCSPHDDQLLAAPQEGAQLESLGVGQRTRRRADHVGKVRQRARIQRIGFGNCPVARAKSRACRGLTTTTGRPAAPRRPSLRAPGPRWLPARSGWAGGSATAPRASRRRWYRWGQPSALRRDVGQCPTGFWPHQSDKAWKETHNRTKVCPALQNG